MRRLGGVTGGVLRLEVQDFAALARVLEQILEGEYDPGRADGRADAHADGLADPPGRAVVATVLHHIGSGEREDT